MVVTLVTGLLLWAHVVFPYPLTWEYGLPLPWRQVYTYWPSIANSGITDWVWIYFGIDAAFYAAVGYLLSIPYYQRHRLMATMVPGIVVSATYVLLVVLASLYLHVMYCDPSSRQCG